MSAPIIAGRTYWAASISHESPRLQRVEVAKVTPKQVVLARRSGAIGYRTTMSDDEARVILHEREEQARAALRQRLMQVAEGHRREAEKLAATANRCLTAAFSADGYPSSLEDE